LSRVIRFPVERARRRGVLLASQAELERLAYALDVHALDAQPYVTACSSPMLAREAKSEDLQRLVTPPPLLTREDVRRLVRRAYEVLDDWLSP
jgi:hypothetical protein